MKLKAARWDRLIIPTGLMLLLIAAIQIAKMTGWRINMTESEPLGIYQLEPVHGLIHRGALVEFCPPTFVTPEAFPFYMHGACSSGGMPMFKQVAGVPGDRVHVNMDGVWINGQRLRFSQQVAGSAKFPKVRLPHQQGNFVLGKGEYWTYGSSAAGQSFDSRYWGKVTLSTIQGIVN